MTALPPRPERLRTDDRRPRAAQDHRHAHRRHQRPHVDRETNLKQRQLDTIGYIYDVEKLLFGAHVNREQMATALERITQMTSAEVVCLWLVENGGLHAFFARDRYGSGSPSRA